MVYKSCRLFNFAFVAQEDLAALTEEAREYLPFVGYVAISLNVTNMLQDLIAELPKYKERAIQFCNTEYDLVTIADKKVKDVPMPYEMWRFWRENSLTLPTWADVSNNVALIATSLADAERGFSMYDGLVSKQQKSSLQDKIEATVLIRHNDTHRRLERKTGRDRLKAVKELNDEMRSAEVEGEEETD